MGTASGRTTGSGSDGEGYKGSTAAKERRACNDWMIQKSQRPMPAEANMPEATSQGAATSNGEVTREAHIPDSTPAAPAAAAWWWWSTASHATTATATDVAAVARDVADLAALVAAHLAATHGATTHTATRGRTAVRAAAELYSPALEACMSRYVTQGHDGQ